jgi:hypothetical protein
LSAFPDPADRRGRLVALTARRRELVDAAVIDHLANEERLLGALSASERPIVTDLLRKLLVSEPFRSLDPVGRDSEVAGSERDDRPSVRDGVASPSRRRVRRRIP